MYIWRKDNLQGLWMILIFKAKALNFIHKQDQKSTRCDISYVFPDFPVFPDILMFPDFPVLPDFLNFKVFPVFPDFPDF